MPKNRKKCIEDGCKRKACFNIKGNSPEYCGPHKKDNMINLNNLCIKCYDKNPSFNLPGLKAEYCGDCKTPDMKNVSNKMCIECNNSRALFNFEGLKRDYCIYCKKPGMININAKICIECNEMQASFNFEGLIPEYCGICKKDGMKNVKSKKCISCNEIRASFNFEGLRPEYCGICKKDGMKNVRNKICIECNETLASFNFEGLRPEYCGICKKDGMKNVRSKMCIECNITLANKNPLYQYHCVYCFVNKYPDNTISRNYKVKERHVVDYIKDNFPEKEFTYDVRINGGCSGRKPDIFRDCLTHSIIIEIDEFQHKSYSEICENRRTMELFKDLASRPTVFIRFNPDSYIDKDNKKVKSCFKIHKLTGLSIINTKKEWNKRLKELKKNIEYHIDNIPQKEVTIVELYYNEC